MSLTRRRGFTLVEMLVVITIIGILMSLLLPVVSSSREVARRTQCSNNLKNIATAFINHEATHGFLPTGGWGGGWVGDPDRGFDRKQPGGWCYNILPFIDNAVLHDLGTMATDKTSNPKYVQKVITTPQPLFYCPSRRGSRAYSLVGGASFYNCSTPSPRVGARSDYAANAGYMINNTRTGETPAAINDTKGPTNLTVADSTTARYNWTYNQLTGICFQRSEVRTTDIVDGASMTYLVGEKCMDPDMYTSGQAANDGLTCYVGYYRETIASTYVDLNHKTTHGYNGYLPMVDQKPDPENTTPNPANSSYHSFRFGSAHVTGFNMALCDGSVRLIAYTIAPRVHLMLGSRAGSLTTEAEGSDNTPLNPTQF